MLPEHAVQTGPLQGPECSPDASELLVWVPTLTTRVFVVRGEWKLSSSLLQTQAVLDCKQSRCLFWPKCLIPTPSIRCLQITMTYTSSYRHRWLRHELSQWLFHKTIWHAPSFGYHSLSASCPQQEFVACTSFFTAWKWRWRSQQCFGCRGKAMSISSRHAKSIKNTWEEMS